MRQRDARVVFLWRERAVGLRSILKRQISETNFVKYAVLRCEINIGKQ